MKAQLGCRIGTLQMIAFQSKFSMTLKASHCLGGCGGYTPDPIPNSAVNHFEADGSRKARVGGRG